MINVTLARSCILTWQPTAQTEIANFDEPARLLANATPSFLCGSPFLNFEAATIAEIKIAHCDNFLIDD